MGVLLPKIKPLIYSNGGPVITVQVRERLKLLTTVSFLGKCQDCVRWNKTRFVVTQRLLYLAVSTHDVIGQFCGPSFTVWPAKFEGCSSPARPINPET